MSEERTLCAQIAEWLLERAQGDLQREWTDHLQTCDECSRQLLVHRALVSTLAGEEIRQLSAGFDAGLESKLAAARVEVIPLVGWRRVAMIAYSVAAAAIVGQALRHVPLPTIDPSAPWMPVAAFLAVPVTFVLAAAASRWLPGPTPRTRRRAMAL